MSSPGRSTKLRRGQPPRAGPTCCCFGDRNSTGSPQRLPASPLRPGARIAEPLAGHVFVLKPVACGIALTLSFVVGAIVTAFFTSGRPQAPPFPSFGPSGLPAQSGNGRMLRGLRGLTALTCASSRRDATPLTALSTAYARRAAGCVVIELHTRSLVPRI